MPPVFRANQHPEEFELLAWSEGDVDARKAAAIAAHVEECPTCRAYLDNARALHDMLRAAHTFEVPPDDPGLARARALAYERPLRTTHPRGRPRRLLPIALAVVVLLATGVALIARNEQTAAGLGINTVVRLLPRYSPERASDAAGPPGESLPRVYGTITPGVTYIADLVAPETLPLGLQRVNVNAASSSGASVTYVSSSGLEIEVAQEVTTTPLELSVGNATQVLVQNTPVLLLLDPTDRVSLAVWDGGDVRFSMYTLTEPPGGLTGAMATEIIATLLSENPIPSHDP